MKVAASPPKKEANPASLRSAAPSKGRGSHGHPSFLWKEGPRRGGGWIGKAVSLTQSLPRVGKALFVGIVFPTFPVFALTLWG